MISEKNSIPDDTHTEINLTRDVLSLALQGDIKSALKLMKEKCLSDQYRVLRSKYIKRFVNNSLPGSRTDDSFVNAVIESYESYWNKVLTGKLSIEGGTPFIFEKLKLLMLSSINLSDYNDDDFEKLIDSLKKKLLSLGYHGIYGITLPFRDLMLWKFQKEKKYIVKFHDGIEEVTVVHLADFAALGWSHYATFGNSYTGGWADRDKLYCVTPSWDLNSENFRVSYLAHEARHFRDYRQFPKLEQADLEYRAKLSELTLADKTLKSLIEKFLTNSADNRESPHSLANFILLRDLHMTLQQQGHEYPFLAGEIPPEDIRRISRELLDRHSQNLLREGAQTVRGIIT